MKVTRDMMTLLQHHNHHRREILQHFVGSIPFIILLDTGKAAHAYPQEDVDKQKIIKGYSRLEYLLNHWQDLTTVCKASVDNPVRFLLLTFTILHLSFSFILHPIVPNNIVFAMYAVSRNRNGILGVQKYK